MGSTKVEYQGRVLGYRLLTPAGTLNHRQGRRGRGRGQQRLDAEAAEEAAEHHLDRERRRRCRREETGEYREEGEEEEEEEEEGQHRWRGGRGGRETPEEELAQRLAGVADCRARGRGGGGVLRRDGLRRSGCGDERDGSIC